MTSAAFTAVASAERREEERSGEGRGGEEKEAWSSDNDPIMIPTHEGTLNTGKTRKHTRKFKGSDIGGL